MGFGHTHPSPSAGGLHVAVIVSIRYWPLAGIAGPFAYLETEGQYTATLLAIMQLRRQVFQADARVATHSAQESSNRRFVFRRPAIGEL